MVIRPLPKTVLRTCLPASLWLLLALATSAAKSAETFGNFHTMGIIVKLPPTVSPTQVSEVRLYMIVNGDLRRLLDPVPASDATSYTTSVFDLKPDTTYEFRSEFLNIENALVHREIFTGRTRAERPPPPQPLREIHVAKHGNDANPGSERSPKQTIAAAMAAAIMPGTHVILHEGIYYEGSLPSVGSGTAKAPIVIRSATNETVIIDGSAPNTISAKWKELGDGYFSLPYLGQSWNVCVRKHQSNEVRRLYPVGSRSNLLAKKVGSHAFETYNVEEAYFCTGEEIIVYCPYYNPDTMTIQIGHQNSLVAHTGSRHITYSDLTYRFFQGQTFYINDASDVTFRRCNFEYCLLPIAVKRASNRLLIEGCSFKDDCNRWGFLPKGMDDVHYAGKIETGAVYVHTPYTGRGMVVRNNVINGLFDGINLAPMGPPSAATTHETDFYNNKILNVCDDLIEADGQCKNIRIFRNKMSNYLSGISIAQAYQGPIYVTYNELLGAGNTSATRLPPSYEGYPVKTNGGTKYGTTGHAFFFHNTCYTDSPNTNAFRVQDAQWKQITMANNIWQGTKNGFVFWRKNISPISITNDLMYAQTGSPLTIASHKYATVEEARERLPSFHNIIEKAPILVDPSNHDFRLRPNSPAVDAGIVIPGINDRKILGAKPDIGANEFQGSKP